MSEKILFPLVALIAITAGVVGYQYHQPKMQLTDGTGVSWQDYQGKWLVVNFFAEWCKPCLKEVPELNQFAKGAKNINAQLLAVSYDPLNADNLLQLKQKYQMEFDLLVTQPRPELLMKWPQQLPTTFIVNPQGQVVDRILGEVTAEKLANKVSSLAKGESVQF